MRATVPDFSSSVKLPPITRCIDFARVVLQLQYAAGLLPATVNRNRIFYSSVSVTRYKYSARVIGVRKSSARSSLNVSQRRSNPCVAS